MFARMYLFFRPEIQHVSDYTRTFEHDIFRYCTSRRDSKDEITLANPGSVDVISISLWKAKPMQRPYNPVAYPEVLKTLARVIDGTPKVQNV